MHVVAHHSVKELSGIASQERHARRLIRLRIVILAMQERTAPEIAAALGISRRAAQNWVYRYNAPVWKAYGIAGAERIDDD